MATIEVKCPRCGSWKVRKHGKTETGYQRYYCPNTDCGMKSFQLEHSYKMSKSKRPNLMKDGVLFKIV